LKIQNAQKFETFSVPTTQKISNFGAFWIFGLGMLNQ
jgi:hypothetical protein